MLVERTNSNTFLVNPLPDGSRVVIDSENERVFAMNATAGAAWDACTVPTTLSAVTQSMQRSLHEEVNQELAEEAIQQLERQRLVKTSGTSPQPTRRKFISTLGAVAVPLVVSLSVAEQKAYAQRANSANNRGGNGQGNGGQGNNGQGNNGQGNNGQGDNAQGNNDQGDNQQ